MKSTALLLIMGAMAIQNAHAAAAAKYRPIVMWHGMGDSCCDARSMGAVKELLEKQLPGVFVHSINTAGADSSDDADRKSSFFGNANEQVSQVCEELRAIPELADGFNAIGFSQGGQFLRAYIQRCNTPAIHRLITFGSQHAGVAAIPQCPPEVNGKHMASRSGADGESLQLSKTWCKWMQAAATRGVYSRYIRDHLIQAQYFKDPTQLDQYMEKNIFLPDVNNELPAKNQQYAQNMRSLDKFVMIMFANDTMVYPKESAWFDFIDAKQQLVPLREQPLYTEDWLGLKTLDEQGKLVFLSKPGNHMRISLEYMTEAVIEPFLSDPVDEQEPKIRFQLQ